MLVKVARAAGSVQDARARWLRERAGVPELPVVFIAAEDADRLEAMAQTPACERTPSAVADEDVIHRGATCCRHPDYPLSTPRAHRWAAWGRHVPAAGSVDRNPVARDTSVLPSAVPVFREGRAALLRVLLYRSCLSDGTRRPKQNDRAIAGPD